MNTFSPLPALPNLPIAEPLGNPTPSIDYSIDIQSPYNVMPERTLTPEDMFKILSRREVLRIVYVPHFLTQCLFHFCELLMKYAADNRIQNCKKATRGLKQLVDGYMRALKMEMSPLVYEGFLKQRAEFLDLCYGHLQIMYFTLSNALSSKYGFLQHAPLYCYAQAVVAISDFIFDYDVSSNRKIAEKMKTPVSSEFDYRVREIRKLCIAISEGYEATKDSQVGLSIRTILNKALATIEDML